jgi:uncharacterized membrane protein (UPF0127 family)
MRAPMLFLIVCLSAAECSRAPAEEFRAPPSAVPAPLPSDAVGAASASGALFRAPPTAAPDTATPDTASGRCVKATPSAPPPPVAPGPAPGCPADPETARTTPQIVPVTFPDASGVRVDAELVRSEHDTTRGLMYRKHMDEERGMLFDLREREDHHFWMHNTCVPLDLLFVDDDGLIVGIVENAPTLNDESRSVGCASRWVLEVNAGWSRRHGVRAGQHLVLPKAE